MNVQNCEPKLSMQKEVENSKSNHLVWHVRSGLNYAHMYISMVNAYFQGKREVEKEHTKSVLNAKPN